MFVLGCAQIGMNYGITNNTGLLNEKDALSLLVKAVKLGITHFDTAQCYGRSEYLLNKLKNLHPHITIITKTKNNTKSNINYDFLLTHSYDSYNGTFDGCSVYNVKEAINVMKRGAKIVQIPINILDGQWFNEEFIRLKYKNDVKIYARSIFLQGILLSDYSKWPKDSEQIYDKLQKLKPSVELCMSYVNSIPWIDYIVIGVDNEEQLANNVNIWNNMDNIDYIKIMNYIGDIDNNIIDPRKW